MLIVFAVAQGDTLTTGFWIIIPELTEI